MISSFSSNFSKPSEKKISAEEEERLAAERKARAKAKWQSAATRAVSPVMKERRKTSLFSDRAKAALADLDRRATTQDMSDLSKYAVARFMSMNAGTVNTVKRTQQLKEDAEADCAGT